MYYPDTFFVYGTFDRKQKQKNLEKKGLQNIVKLQYYYYCYYCYYRCEIVRVTDQR